MFSTEFVKNSDATSKVKSIRCDTDTNKREVVISGYFEYKLPPITGVLIVGEIENTTTESYQMLADHADRKEKVEVNTLTSTYTAKYEQGEDVQRMLVLITHDGGETYASAYNFDNNQISGEVTAIKDDDLWIATSGMHCTTREDQNLFVAIGQVLHLI
jgi:hypothetical protein